MQCIKHSFLMLISTHLPPRRASASSYFVLTSEKKNRLHGRYSRIVPVFPAVASSHTEHLAVFSGVFCRCRNEELLQEDGIWAGGTVYGEGPVWTWTGLNLDNVFIWPVDTGAHIILFIKIISSGHSFCSAFRGTFVASEEITAGFFSQSGLFIWCTAGRAVASPPLHVDKETVWEGARGKVISDEARASCGQGFSSILDTNVLYCDRKGVFFVFKLGFSLLLWHTNSRMLVF